MLLTLASIVLLVAASICGVADHPAATRLAIAGLACLGARLTWIFLGANDGKWPRLPDGPPN